MTINWIIHMLAIYDILNLNLTDDILYIIHRTVYAYLTLHSYSCLSAFWRNDLTRSIISIHSLQINKFH